MDQSVIERTLRHVDAQGLVDLASNLIRIPSFSPEETPAAKFLAEYFRPRGYEVEMQEVEPGRFQTIATLRGTGGGQSLMFNGHLDINSLKLGARRDPWTPTVEGDRLYGHGGENMKGGVATMITAAEAIRTAGIRLRGDLVIACVVGETQGGEGTHHLVQSGLRTDMAILPEPYGIEHLVTIHGGIVHLAIHTYGITGHLSQMEKTVNAVLKMAKVVQALPDVRFTFTPRPELPALPRLNVGSVIGGRGPRYVLHEPPYVPDFCTAMVDVHFVPGQTVDGIVADIRRVLDGLVAEDPQLRYEIEIPPPAGHAADRRPPGRLRRPGGGSQPRARDGAPAGHDRRDPADVLLRGRLLLALGGRDPVPLLRTPRRLHGPGPGRRVHVHQRDGRLRQGAGAHRPGGLRVTPPVRTGAARGLDTTGAGDPGFALESRESCANTTTCAAPSDRGRRHARAADRTGALSRATRLDDARVHTRGRNARVRARQPRDHPVRGGWLGSSGHFRGVPALRLLRLRRNHRRG